MRRTPAGKRALVPRTPLLTLPILAGRHQLAITRLKRTDDCFTLKYTVTPPLPDPVDGLPTLPVLEAEDDLGNAYDDYGGAFGTSPDGTHTDGSLSARPALDPDAGTLRLRITYLHGGKETAYDVTLGIRH